MTSYIYFAVGSVVSRTYTIIDIIESKTDDEDNHKSVLKLMQNVYKAKSLTYICVKKELIDKYTEQKLTVSQQDITKIDELSKDIHEVYIIKQAKKDIIAAVCGSSDSVKESKYPKPKPRAKKPKAETSKPADGATVKPIDVDEKPNRKGKKDKDKEDKKDKKEKEDKKDKKEEKPDDKQNKLEAIKKQIIESESSGDSGSDSDSSSSSDD